MATSIYCLKANYSSQKEFPLDYFNVRSHHCILSHTERKKERVAEGSKNSRSAFEHQRRWLYLLDLLVEDERVRSNLPWSQTSQSRGGVAPELHVCNMSD